MGLGKHVQFYPAPGEEGVMKRKILVVDDSSADLYMMETLLKGHGYDVATAENGEQALEKARLDPPDLVVSDILMPVMDGYNLCREWKADDTLRRRPFALYTATYMDSKSEALALDLGVDRFILKPQEPDVLIGIIRELLGEGYRARQVEARSTEEEMELCQQYNEVLFNKLEQKMQDLETANRKLRLSEESYRRTFLNASDVIYTVDGDLILRSISPSVERILGYKAKDFVDRPVTEFGRLVLTPESFERAIADLATVLGGQTIDSTVYEFIAGDGTLKYGEVSGSPLMQQDGRITGIVSVARDITDRVLTERALRENEEKYRSLFDHCLDAVYSFDAEGGFLSVNDSTCRISGYSREELMRMEFAPLIVPEERRKVRSHFQKALHGEPQNYETTILHKDGGRVIIQVTNTPVTVEDKIVGVYAIAEDITDRVRAERTLRENEEKYRSMFGHSMDAILLTRPDGTILDANPAACTMFGRTREEIVRIGRNGLVDTEDPRLHAALKNRAAEGATMAEFTMIRANGEKFPVEMTSAIFEDESGRQKSIMIIRDITERKQIEDERRISEEKFRSFVEQSSEGIYLFEPNEPIPITLPIDEQIRKIYEGNIIECNDRQAKMYGFMKAEDLKGVSLAEFHGGTDKPENIEFIRSWIKADYRITNAISSEVDKDGNPVWFRNNLIGIVEHGFLKRVWGTQIDITEIKKIEVTLQQTNAFLNSIVENIPDMVFVKDAGELRFVRLNRAGENLLGHSRDELLGKNDYDFFPKQQADFFVERDRSVLHEKAIVEIVEEPIQTRNKGERILHTKKVPILGTNGEPEYLLGISEDITDSIRQERALRESERRYREMSNLLPIPLFETDLSGKVILANPVIFETFGYTQADFEEGLHGFQMILPGDQERLAKNIQDLLAGKWESPSEYTGIRKDGSTVPLLVYPSVVHRDGKPVGFRGAMIDLTDRKLMEESLRKSNFSLSEAQRIAHIGSWEWDVESNNIYWSDEIYRILGITPQRFEGGTHETFLGFVFPDERDRVKQALEKTRQSGAKSEIDHHINRSDGSVRDIHQWLEPIMDHTGKVVRVFGTVQDVTERNQMDKELDDARNQLIQSEKLASLGRFSAGVAHEILNPVNIISMELQMLMLKENTPLEVREELKICMEQIKRIVNIAQDLKQFARMDSKKTVKSDINDTIAYVLNLSATQLKIEGVEIEVQYQPDLPMMVMDKGKIQQVILNLISNAVDAMAEKETKVLRIRTDLEKTSEDSESVKVTIADSGQGISSESMSKIFDPFFTTKEVGKGTGLGLSISYGIIHDHGGMIWADNNEWGGASFYFRLPVKTDG